MLLKRYGVLVGKAVAARREDSADTPHYELPLRAAGTDYRIAVNVKSEEQPSELLYLIEEDFQHRPTASSISSGAPSPSRTPGCLPSASAGGRSPQRRTRSSTSSLSFEMTKRLRLRFLSEVVFGAICAIALALTLVWPDWIERGFGFDPDGGDGSVEWGMVLLMALLSLGSMDLAWRDWRRLAQAWLGEEEERKSPNDRRGAVNKTPACATDAYGFVVDKGAPRSSVARVHFAARGATCESPVRADTRAGFP
jgi:hypothetical protein